MNIFPSEELVIYVSGNINQETKPHYESRG
jgi:hypothetical protein